MSIIPRRTLSTAVTVSCALLLATPAALLHTAAARADTGRVPGTLFFAGPGADTVSTLFAGTPGDPIGAGLTRPRGIAVDVHGNVFVADTAADRVVRIDADGSQTVLADGLSAPSGVAVDATGHVFVADTGNSRVVQLGADGPQEVAGGLLQPVAVAIAPSGDVLVADAGADAVFDLAPDGTRTQVGTGLAGPRGVAVDASGTVVVADTANDRVVTVTPDGTQADVGSGLRSPSAVALGGDGTVYVADTDNGRIVAIAPDGTQTDVADVPAVALAAYVAGQTVAFTSTVPAIAAVGGTYVVSATGGVSGQPVVFSTESAACTVDTAGTVTFTSVGTCVISADQAGTVEYSPATRVQQSLEVVRGSQTVTFTSATPGGPTVGNTYTATATGGGSGQPVTFSADGTSTACTVDSDGTVTFTHAGNCAVDADQDGDTNWAPAVTVQQAFTITRGAQAITFTSGVPDAAVVGGSYLPSAVGGGSGLPVTFSVDPSSATCSIDVGGTVNFLHAGICTVLADQAGDDDWTAADQVAQVVTVGRRTATLTFSSSPPADPVVGQTYVAIASPNSTYTADSTSTGCTVAPDGTVTLVGVGTCVVDAADPGDADTEPSTAAQTFAIGRGSQTISFASTVPANAGVGDTYVASATGGASGQPVVFGAGASSVACTVAADGTVHFTSVGSCIVNADQGGTADYEPAPRVQQSFRVGRGAQLLTFTSTPPAAALVTGTYVATASGGASGKPVRFGTTTASSSVCTVTTLGVVRFTGVGTCTVVATQSGSTLYLAAPAARQYIHAYLRQQIRFTSTPLLPELVGGHYRVTATGGDSGKKIVFAVSAASSAVCGITGATLTNFAAGVCTIVASQDGTTKYAPASSTQPYTVFSHGQASVSPIKHVVLIFQENHSFDETLGAYCQTRSTPCDGYVGNVRLKGGTVVPMTHSPDIVPDVEHGVPGQIRAIDGGAMDGWATLHGCTPPNYSCLSYHQPSDIPNLAALADRFVVSDRTFSLSSSPSWGGHLYAAAATLDGFTGENPKIAPGVAAGPGWGCDSDKVTAWLPTNGVQATDVPSCIPDTDGSGPFLPSPAAHVSTIFDELKAQHLPWKIYGATKPAQVGNEYLNGYAWSICPSFADCLYTDEAQNLVPSPQILDDAANGTLPAYSVLTPSRASAELVGTSTSQHNNASMLAGDNWIGRTVSAIESGPDWDSTAIFITYDDCGCFYDHVAPPTNPDGTQQGIRVPMVIVSPYAKPGYTDSNNATLASVLAFTERTLGLPALSSNDAAAYDFGQSFQLTAPPRAGVALHQSTVPKASITYAKAHPDGDDAT